MYGPAQVKNRGHLYLILFDEHCDKEGERERESNIFQLFGKLVLKQKVKNRSPSRPQISLPSFLIMK